MKTIQFTLNGETVSLSVDPEESLLGALRERLGLTGTKFGCGSGFCGSCTVIMDGEAVRSCVTPAEDAEGSDIQDISV